MWSSKVPETVCPKCFWDMLTDQRFDFNKSIPIPVPKFDASSIQNRLEKRYDRPIHDIAQDYTPTDFNKEELIVIHQAALDNFYTWILQLYQMLNTFIGDFDIKDKTNEIIYQ